MHRQHSMVILPSWRLAAVLVLLVLGGLVLVARYLPMELALLGGFLLVVLCGKGIALHAAGRSRHAISALRLGPDGLDYQTRNGVWGRARLVRGSFVHPLLTIVTMRDDSMSFAHRHVVLVPGRIDKDDFRGLRVWLKWNELESEDGALFTVF